LIFRDFVEVVLRCDIEEQNNRSEFEDATPNHEVISH
jgi:hypothetical protein